MSVGSPLQLADELECDYSTLLQYRHQRREAALLGLDRSPLADAVAEGDDLFQNAGEKGEPRRVAGPTSGAEQWRTTVHRFRAWSVATVGTSA